MKSKKEIGQPISIVVWMADLALKRIGRSLGKLGMTIAALSLFSFCAHASDHADPVSLPMPWDLLDNAQPKPDAVRELTGGITDLIVFPVNEKDERLSFPQPNEKRSPFSEEERKKIGSLTPAQRSELSMSPRKERSAKLAAMTPGDPAAVMLLTREELAKLERLTPKERWDLQVLKPEQIQQAKALVFILCVRRALPPGTSKLELEPYTYTISMDPDTKVIFDAPSEPPAEATRINSERARYGGSVLHPENIEPKITLTFQLNNDATMKKPGSTGLLNDEAKSRIVWFPSPSSSESAIRDDPFVFPPFFRTNVVAMAAKVPIECFAPDKRSWVIWAASYRDGKKIDHVGRSLRTQQPRFARLFNEYEPKDQVAAFDRELAHPDLLRDLLVRFDVPALFNYRNWDRTPDVMIYNMAFDCRYPNGRLLTDDVAAELAENGDALLQELSYVGDTWPRATENDKPFQTKFPYLAAPWTADEVKMRPLPPNPPVLKDPLALSGGNKAILVIVTAIVLLVPFLLGWGIAELRCRKRWQERYL